MEKINLFKKLSVLVLGLCLFGMAQALPPAASAPTASVAAAPALGEVSIEAGQLRILLHQPATVTLYSSSGQVLYRLESSGLMEYLPLAGQESGFLYVHFRAGALESVRKILFPGNNSGK